jgi:hypothetical protein
MVIFIVSISFFSVGLSLLTSVYIIADNLADCNSQIAQIAVEKFGIDIMGKNPLEVLFTLPMEIFHKV